MRWGDDRLETHRLGCPRAASAKYQCTCDPNKKDEAVGKYTPERRKAFGRVVHAARAFVRAVDEFGEDDPSALAERHEELVIALDAEGRAWDGGPELAVLSECDPHSLRVTRTG